MKSGRPPKKSIFADFGRGNGAKRHTPASNAYHARRREERDRDDQALLEAMRRNSEATIGELAMAIGKAKTSVVSALHRLRETGLVESSDGHWQLTEAQKPREPTASWVAPVRGGDRATQPHMT